MFKVEVYDSVNDAETTWRRFEHEGTALPYQTYDWVSTWWDTIGADTGSVPCPVAVRDSDGSPLMLLPFRLARSGNWAGRITTLRWLADDSLGDQLAPVLAGRAHELSSDEMQSLWAQVLDALPAVDLIILRNQPSTILGRVNPVHKLDLHFSYVAGRHLTSLTGDWDSYYRFKVKAAKRADMRRKLRRLGEQGEVEFHEVTEPVDRQLLLDTVIRQKRERFAETRVSDMFAAANYEGFYRELTRSAPDLVHLSALTVDDQTVATLFGLVHGCTYYYLVPTFDSDRRWRQHSPGRLLTEMMISRSFDLGLDRFDFSIGDESYKRDWCERTTPLYGALQRCSGLAHARSLAGKAGRKVGRRQG